jgi:hypothetical protein
MNCGWSVKTFIRNLGWILLEYIQERSDSTEKIKPKYQCYSDYRDYNASGGPLISWMHGQFILSRPILCPRTFIGNVETQFNKLTKVWEV